MELFAACPKGLEELLHEELLALGAEEVRSTVAGVYANGSLGFAYQACLWSRLANRILLPLTKFKMAQADDLYEGCRTIAWQHHIGKESTIAVQFSGTDEQIRHSQFGAQRVKDAIVDILRETCGFRPEVDAKTPDILINARLSKGQVVISLDLSGGSLHRRGYRQSPVAAPLKENLAAALLIRAGWPKIAASGGALIDPLCGSGTFLVEGAMMAADIAPGLNRRQFGFEHWLKHDAALWQEIKEQAQQRKKAGLALGLPEIRGYDKDTRAVDAAGKNILQAGLSLWVRVSPKPLQAFKKPTHKELSEGLIICNPPYGERWGDVDTLRPLYQTLGERMKQECTGWRLAVFSGNADLMGELKLRAYKKFKLFNGTIPSQLQLFELHEIADKPVRTDEPRLPEGAQMLLNRLKKNAKKLRPWLKRENITCYRLYDKDMPEYAVAIDVYSQADQPPAIHVQEYAPPATIDEVSARQRLTEVKNVLYTLLPESRNALFFKERKRQKGSSQYSKNKAETFSKKGVYTVREGTASLEVNLSDYLDSGLFLDHRPVRKMLHDLVEGKRFLNLFCYTATATVQAVLGGAKSSLSIDMSQTYLEWARRNFELNGINPYQHKIQREDCLAWLSKVNTQTEEKHEYDVIFLDPPTFSNSSKMDKVLDIQRDHIEIIKQTMGLLAKEGVLVFSTNFRKFKMDESILASFSCEDISKKTIPQDYSRNPKIHQCWLIRHA